NGVTGIFSLSLAVRDAPAAAEAWGRILGLVLDEPVEDEADRLKTVRLSLGNCHLEFVSTMGEGALARHLAANGESPYLLSLRVADLDRCAAQLTARGVSIGPLRETSDGLRRALSADQTEGVNLELVQAG
ncbi:MAG: VOC family protein, partial [Planctomycetota bacterium]